MSSQSLLAQLAVVCPSCDHYNAPGASKCISCGSALEMGAPAAKPAAPRPATTPGPQPALGDVGTPSTNPFARPTAQRTASNPALPAQPPPPGVPKTATPAPLSQARPAVASQGAPPNLRPSARTPSGPQPLSTGSQPTPLPTTRAPAPPQKAPPAAAPMVPTLTPVEPIPATELVKKPQPKVPPPAASTNAARFALVVVGGSAQGQRFRLAGAGFVLGRSRGAILFPDDPFVSAHHATFTVRDGRLYVRDESSASGVYVTIHGQEPLQAQSCFSVGNHCFRFTGVLEPLPPQPGRPVPYGAPVPAAQTLYGVEELLVGGRPGRAIVTANPLLTIGSSKCDLTFAAEEGLAARHCELSPQMPGAMLRDLSGGLGTYVRISAASDRLLTPGDRLRVGEQVLQVEAIA